MPQQLPLTSEHPQYRFGTSLDGVQFTIDVRWNGRDEAWYMDVLTDDGTPIRRGIKMVLGTLLGGRCIDPGFPDGVLIAADQARLGRDATVDDLGERVAVFFIPYED
jgi:hypothetical protein